jgi:hypothetical protein
MLSNHPTSGNVFNGQAPLENPLFSGTKRLFARLAPVLFAVFFGVVNLGSCFAQSAQEPGFVPYHISAKELDKRLGVDETAPKPERFIRLVYFHRTPGCNTCQTMASYVFQTVESEFRKQTQNKTLVLRYIDFEDPKNRAFVRAFNINSPTLIAIESVNSKDVRYWKLGRIWSLAGNKEEFQRYIFNEVTRILERK